MISETGLHVKQTKIVTGTRVAKSLFIKVFESRFLRGKTSFLRLSSKPLIPKLISSKGRRGVKLREDLPPTSLRPLRPKVGL